jgi:chaperonin GroES
LGVLLIPGQPRLAYRDIIERLSPREIIAMGPGGITEDGKRQPMEVRGRDRILFGKWSGSEVKLGDEEYLIMRGENILGILA